MMDRGAHALRVLLSIALACVTVVALAAPALPPIAKALVAIVLAAALWNPDEAFLLAAGLAPLSALIASLFDADAYRLTEAIVLAFFSGLLLRGWPAATAGPAPPRYASVAAWLFVAVILGSIAGLAWQLSRFPGELTALMQGIAGSYYLTDRIGLVDAAKLLEGLGLAAVTIALFRGRPAFAMQVPAALTASAVCAVFAAVALWRGVGPYGLLQRHSKLGYRVAAHVGDVNAAGSYFAMVLCLALGMAARERGARRAIWLAASAACALGIWLSASRTALASATIVIALAVAWIATARWGAAPRLMALGALLAVLLAVGAARAHGAFGSGFRVEFNQTSGRMIAARPVFGIGVGRYFAESPLFFSPQLAWTYGFENAHNNFLQIVAEMGVVGFVLFAISIGGGLALAARALGRAPNDWRLLGAFAGLIAFLGTCLFGHPLLVAEVACAFWIQFGLVVCLASSTLLNLDVRSTDNSPREGSALSTTAIVVGALVLVGAEAWTLREPLTPAASQAVDGFYEWDTGADGVRYRWSEEYASVFVPADVLHVWIPVRVPKEALTDGPMGIEVSTNGIGGRFVVEKEGWTNISVILKPTIPPTGFTRINLRMDRTWQPAQLIPGSTDSRSVGIQAGEYRVVRTR